MGVKLVEVKVLKEAEESVFLFKAKCLTTEKV